jgi:hypothetical protein
MMADLEVFNWFMLLDYLSCVIWYIHLDFAWSGQPIGHSWENDSYSSDLSNILSCPHLELYKNDIAWTEALGMQYR